MYVYVVHGQTHTHALVTCYNNMTLMNAPLINIGNSSLTVNQWSSYNLRRCSCSPIILMFTNGALTFHTLQI